jgi:hypothetical protein
MYHLKIIVEALILKATLFGNGVFGRQLHLNEFKRMDPSWQG